MYSLYSNAERSSWINNGHFRLQTMGNHVSAAYQIKELTWDKNVKLLLKFQEGNWSSP